jgi:Zn-finger nucleic acid-binding protein
MICPRCAEDLRPETQAGVPVDRCPSCWGTWLDKGEFSRLLAVREHRFAEEEIDAVFKGLVHEANTPKPKPDPALNCPTCGKAMGKVRHNAAKLITLDRCDAHGLWCDTKELKQAQVSAQVLKMLLNQASQ